MVMQPVIHVVDDDADFRAQVSDALKAEGYLVVQSGTAEQFLDVFDPQQQGCILMDERMPGFTGSETLTKIAKWLPIVPALLVTGYADVPLAVGVMRSGAFDVVEKPFSLEQLLTRVKDAVTWNNEIWHKHATDARVWSDMQSLTPRESEILELIIEGQSSKAIASRLKISARTVDNHRVHIISKMRAKSLSDLGRSVARATALFGEGGLSSKIGKTWKSGAAS
jgi:FixJ family two-component response regulator